MTHGVDEHSHLDCDGLTLDLIAALVAETKGFQQIPRHAL